MSMIVNGETSAFTLTITGRATGCKHPIQVSCCLNVYTEIIRFTITNITEKFISIYSLKVTYNRKAEGNL